MPTTGEVTVHVKLEGAEEAAAELERLAAGFAALGPRPETPELSVLVALGSVAVHLEEWLETHEDGDLRAARAALNTPGVLEWREEMGPLLPLKRTEV